METIKIYHKKKIPPKEVVLLKGDTNYTELHFQNGDKIIIAKTLKLLHDVFSTHGFFRISKTNMINIKYLSLTNEKFSIVKLKNNVELNVSRRRRDNLKDFLLESQTKK
jgi:DNA-binding LytR/AlgR family response regulator